MDAVAEQLWLSVNSAPYRRLSGGRAEQCPLGHTTPSLQTPETSTLPPCLGPVLTGLLPRHCFSPSARQSRPNNRPGPPPQYSSGFQPAALLECLLRAGRCGGCWGRAVGKDEMLSLKILTGGGSTGPGQPPTTHQHIPALISPPQAAQVG